MAENTEKNLPSSESSKTYSVYFILINDADPDSSETKGQITIYTQGPQQYKFEYIINTGSSQRDSRVTVLPEFLRYVGKHYTSEDDNSLFSFIVSYVQPTENDVDGSNVKNLFIEPEVNSQYQDIYEDLKFLVRGKFNDSDLAICKSDKDKAIELVLEQPLYVGTLYVDVRVKDAAADKKLLRGDALCVVDMECMCIYKDGLEKPDYQLWFWKKAAPMVVDKILVKGKEGSPGTIVFETGTHIFTLPKRQKSVDVLSQLQPKPKNLLASVLTLLAYVAARREQEGLESVSRQISHPPGQFAQSQLGKIETDNLLDEFAVVNLKFAVSEEFQAEWVPYQCRITELELAAIIPESDLDSTGLELNNMAHVRQVFSNILAHIIDNDLPMALSVMKACRKFFGESADPSIQQIFMETNSDILKQVYFRPKTEYVAVGRGGFNVTQDMWEHVAPASSRSQYGRRSGGGKDYCVGPSQKQKEVDVLLDELDRAGREFENNEDFQAIWATFEHDLEELALSGDVPESDFTSGGLDSADVRHLRRAVTDIQDQVQDGDIRIALSRMRACRMFFVNSPTYEIYQLFDENTDISLLRKIYFRSMLF